MRAIAFVVLCACGGASAPPASPIENATPTAVRPGTVQISTKVVDAESERVIEGALVMVLRPGVDINLLDVTRLAELEGNVVLTRGRSNTRGEVTLADSVRAPGTYGVIVVAKGYEPLIGADALQLAEGTASYFDPWGSITLRACTAETPECPR